MAFGVFCASLRRTLPERSRPSSLAEHSPTAIAKVASSRNPPQRLRGGAVPRLSAVGICGLQAGEDVNPPD